VDNQFCKSCGQANFPGSTVCTKCGQALSPAGGNPFNQPNQAPNPGAQNQAPQPAAPKKSSKKFWIIGGIAAFLLLSLGGILIAAVGGFLYFNSQKDEVVYDYPKPDQTPTPTKDDDDTSDSDNPLDDIDFPSSGDTDFGGGSNGSVSDSVLVKFFKEKKPRVGSYRLQSTQTMDGKGFFRGKTAGAMARYTSGSKSIVHEISVYSNKDNARRDFDRFKASVKSTGGKIRSNRKDQIIYAQGKLVYLGFINPQGGIHVISSRRGPDIITYYKAYFG